jgi:hypothetical protein
VGWWDDRQVPLDPRTADPRIDVDESSGLVRAVVAGWTRAVGPVRGSLVMARSDDGGCSWSVVDPLLLPEDGQQPDVAVSVALDTIAAAYVRWGAVEAVVSTDGGRTFGAPAVLSPGPATTPPRIANVPVAGALHLHVAWMEGASLRLARSLSGGRAGTWEVGPPLSDRLTGWTFTGAPDVAADTRSRDPSAHSAVTVLASAVEAGRVHADVVVLRSPDSGTTFYGDPADVASLDAPRVISSPRPDAPGADPVDPSCDGSDDGSGVFFAWTAAAWTDPLRIAGPSRVMDARAEEDVTPTVVADWNDPPRSDDVVLAPTETRGHVALSVVPNPLGRPPAPEVHAFSWEAPAAGSAEVHAAWGVLDEAALPTVVLRCGASQLTGVSPPRAGGGVQAAPSSDEDLSHAWVVWLDDGDGTRRVHWKRNDTVTAPPQGVVAAPRACPDGGSILVTWSAPAAPPHCDVDRYRVEWGTAPGGADGALDVDAAAPLQAVLTGLVGGTRYFVRVTTVDEACNEATSLETSAVAPSCAPVLCPNPVGWTLRVGKQGDDVLLAWQPPAIDTGHDAAESYDHYRSTVAPDGRWTLHQNQPGPSATDLGAARVGSPTPRHHHLVVARNACGTSGDEPPP